MQAINNAALGLSTNQYAHTHTHIKHTHAYTYKTHTFMFKTHTQGHTQADTAVTFAQPALARQLSRIIKFIVHWLRLPSPPTLCIYDRLQQAYNRRMERGPYTIVHITVAIRVASKCIFESQCKCSTRSVNRHFALLSQICYCCCSGCCCCCCLVRH